MWLISKPMMEVCGNSPCSPGLDGGSRAREAMDKSIGVQARKQLTGGELNPTWVEWLMGWPLEDRT